MATETGVAMTDAERLQTVKPGDVLNQHGCTFTAIFVAGDYIVGFFESGRVMALRAKCFAWPDAPKAEPGRRYHDITTVGVHGVGLSDGRIASGRSCQCVPVPFEPERWKPVED